MTDYDKVVKGLEAHIGEHKTCLFCPYTNIEGATCMTQMHKEALSLIREQQELLKAQTPVKPVKSKLSWEHGYNWDIWDCGHCGSQLRSDANYCDRCGHKVNWDDMEENDA